MARPLTTKYRSVSRKKVKSGSSKSPKNVNFHQTQQSNQRLVELTSLFELSKLLNSSLDLKEILNNILLVPMGRMMISKGVVLLKETEPLFVIEVIKGLSRDWVGKKFSLVFDFGKPAFVDDLTDTEGKEFLIGNGMEIILPLIAKNRSLGGISYGKKLSGTPYSEGEIQFLFSLSNIGATAIENALVFRELQNANTERDRKIQELNTIFDIGKELNSMLDVEKIIKLLSYALMGQIMVNKFVICQKTEEGRMEIRMSKSIQFPFSDLSEADAFFSGLCHSSQPVFAEKAEDENVRSVLVGAGAVLLIPMRLQEETKGLIVLGEKVTRQPYSPGEVEFLFTLANQAMISLENARLFQEALEKQRLEEELNIARKIQQQLLPKKFPELPGFEIHGMNVPSKQVGGDYYDVIQLDSTHIGLAIADVSGKGTPAALLMANIQASLRALTFEHIPIPKMVARINNLIHQNTEMDKFITFFYGVIDLENKVFSYCNAGHNPPYLMHPDGNFQLLEKGGVLLGILEGLEYEVETVVLSSGDRMFLFTDGISEAMNLREEEFEEKRIEEVLKQTLGMNARETLNAMDQAVREFTKGAPQSDDITMLALSVQ